MRKIPSTDSTLRGGLETQAGLRPGAVFLQAARNDLEVTYSDMLEAADAWARAELPADTVALAISNPVTFGVTFVALIAAGVTVVPLDPKAPGLENLRLMAQAHSQVVVSDSDLDWAPELVTTSVVELPQRPRPSDHAEGAVMLFSSGSTGERKLIRLTESMLVREADLIAEHHGLQPGDSGYNSLPLHHVNGEVVGVLATMRAGATLVLDGSFHRTGFWKLMNECEITWINAVPAIIAILTRENHDNYDLASIRFVRSASAPLPVAVLERFEASHSLEILESYGITEGTSQVTVNPLHGLRKPGSVGLPVGVGLRVANKGNVCGAGEIGTIEIRGATVIESYVNNVAADRFSSEGWLDTGDQGYLDDDGYLFLVGRTDDVINRGGEKIFPREIEELLSQDEAVTSAIVAPKSDEVVGQVPIAFVTVNADHDTEPRLTQLCQRSLPRYMQPAAVVVLDKLPRGVTGKPSRHRATELAEQMPWT